MTTYSLYIYTGCIYNIQSYAFPSVEPLHCLMSGSNCCFLIYIQFSQETGKVDWYSHFLQNFPQFVVIHTVKGSSAVNEAEADVFLEFLVFSMIQQMLANLVSGSSAFSKPSVYTWNFLVHILLKPSLKDFERNRASMWNEYDC